MFEDNNSSVTCDILDPARASISDITVKVWELYLTNKKTDKETKCQKYGRGIN